MHVASSPIIKVSFRRLSSRSTNFHWFFFARVGPQKYDFFYFSPNQKSDHTFVSQTFDSEQLSLKTFSSKVKIWKKFCKPAEKKVRFSSFWICLCVKVKMLFTRAGDMSGRRFAPKKLKIGFVPCNLFFALKVSDILKKLTNVNVQLT